MLAVIKKELKSYLLTPIGYIFIGAFLGIFSLFFYITIFNSGIFNFEYLFLNGTTIATFIIPVLTMRMFSEERKSVTDQLLLTSPRSIVSIVLGKFISGMIILTITELLTLIYFFILKYFGKPSLEIAISTLVGFFLLCLVYTSLGMFVSSMTENQIIAVFVTVVIFLMFWFLPQALQSLLPQILPESILSPVLAFLDVFSFVYMFENFVVGTVYVKDIIAFISFAVLFILLTIISLQRRKSVK